MTTPLTQILAVPTILGQLHVQVAGPAEGATALLWPSLFSNGETSWGTQLAGLHELGWRTLLVDPPCTGGSPSTTRVFTMDECAVAALQILDAAGVDRAAFLGLSWGGFVALRAALSAPRRVIALVLSNTTARRSTFFERQRGRLFVGLARLGIPGLGRMIAATMLSEHSRSHNPAFATQFAAGADKLDSTGLDRISAPTLVIAGDKDTIFPRAHSEEMVERIPGAQLEVLPNVAHLAPCEAPVAFAGLLKSFLAGKGTQAP